MSAIALASVIAFTQSGCAGLLGIEDLTSPDDSGLTTQGSDRSETKSTDGGTSETSASVGSEHAPAVAAGDGSATVPPSCVVTGSAPDNGQTNCGPNNDDDCCKSLLVVGAPDGGFMRGYDGDGFYEQRYKAAVANFRLDKFEVTVGRFRKFVDARKGRWQPATGSGKHTHLNGGHGLRASDGGTEEGWSADWTTDGGLGAGSNRTCDDGQATWTADVGSDESLPMNCVDWFEALAFCIWDGGFLPSEAEWNYAAAGGSKQRRHAWDESVHPSVQWGTGKVGATPAGDGFYGQSDLTGNVSEWVLDGFDQPPLSPDQPGYPTDNCENCTTTSPVVSRMIRGAFSTNPVCQRQSGTPTAKPAATGFRCARAP